jgi:hypothetical protein
MFPPSVAPKPHIGILADGFFEKDDVAAGEFAFRQFAWVFGAYFELGTVVTSFYFIQFGEVCRRYGRRSLVRAQKE